MHLLGECLVVTYSNARGSAADKRNVTAAIWYCKYTEVPSHSLTRIERTETARCNATRRDAMRRGAMQCSVGERKFGGAGRFENGGSWYPARTGGPVAEPTRSRVDVPGRAPGRTVVTPICSSDSS